PDSRPTASAPEPLAQLLGPTAIEDEPSVRAHDPTATLTIPPALALPPTATDDRSVFAYSPMATDLAPARSLFSFASSRTSNGFLLQRMAAAFWRATAPHPIAILPVSLALGSSLQRLSLG